MAYDFNILKIKTNEQLKYEILIAIVNFDNWYYSQFDRVKYHYTKKRNRTIKTEFGNITYQRRIYKDKETKINICPTDLEFGLQPMKRVNNDLKQIIINQIDKGKRYQDIKDLIPNAIISLVTISNIFKNSNLIINIQQEKVKILENEKLYINMDDCYMSLLNEEKKVKKYCIRIFSFNTGKEHISKDRNHLLNKRITYLILDPSKKMNKSKSYNFLLDTINNYYDIKINRIEDFKPNNNLIIGGDGANWIKSMADWLEGNYILDGFHAIKHIWKLFVAVRGKKKESTDWTKYLTAKDLFNNGNYNDFMKMLEENNIDKKIINYFRENEEGIINHSQDWNIGVSAESDVFHLVKSLKGNGAKIYNYKTFNNMLIARANQINNRI